MIVSHHHSDHYGGMDQVIRNFKPKYFMATGSSHTTKGYLKLLQTVKAEGITAVEPTAKPRKIELGSVLLTVFPQPPVRPRRGEQQLDRRAPRVRQVLGADDRRQRGPTSGSGGSRTTPT